MGRANNKRLELAEKKSYAYSCSTKTCGRRVFTTNEESKAESLKYKRLDLPNLF